MTYNATINITEEERLRISTLHDLTILTESISKKISKFRFTPDSKYVLFEEKLYSTETGQLHPQLLEGRWSAMDIIHFVGDVGSMALPGVGAAIDMVNAIIYFVEALVTKDKEKSKKLWIMGGITAAFAIVPGALQGVAIPLKRFIKYGTKVKNAKVAQGIKIIGKKINPIMKALPERIIKTLDSDLGKRIFKGNRDRIIGQMNKMIKNLDENFAKVVKGTEDDGFRKTIQNKRRGKRVTDGKSPMGMAGKATRIPMTLIGMRRVHRFLFGTIKEGVNYTKLLSKLGFKEGHVYGYVMIKGQSAKTMKYGTKKAIAVEVIEINGDVMRLKMANSKQTFAVSSKTFIDNAIRRPWGRRGKSRLVPFFIKRLSQVLLPEGKGVDHERMNSFPDLDPTETSMESLNYLHVDLSTTDGTQTKKAARATSNTIFLFQGALIALGYKLSNGMDGKVSPETEQALRQFQSDAHLTGSDGRMDRLTAHKMATELKARSVPNSEKIQRQLNNL